jgi:Anti-sigma-K factor rskA, C-terminal/Anti-sigma-K factor RskA, N-terminal domain
MRLRGSDPHTLAGAYAMDAVDEPDRVRFERHLAGCEPCRQEVRGLREATAALAAATAVQPTAALRDTTLRAAGQTRQTPAAPAAWPGPRRRRRLVLGLAAGAAAVVVAVAVVAGVSASGMQDRLDQAQQHDHAVATVLSAPDATMLTGPVRTGGTATVVMSHRDRALVFTAADLRVLPSAKRYELWLMGPSGDRPAGMVTASPHGGMAGPMVVSGLLAGDSVGLTVEPASGSHQPTALPVLMISLS